MRTPLIFVALTGLLLGFAPMAEAQGIAPPVSEKFPFQIEMVMDGGTLAILEKASKGKPEKRYCIDGTMNSRTAGELFIGNLHQTLEGARQAKPKEATEVLAHIEKRLGDFLGAEKFKDYREKPIDLEAMSEEEAEEKIKDPAFNDRIATQMLLAAIDEYRKSHKTEQAAKEEAAPLPESKPDGDAKPQAGEGDRVLYPTKAGEYSNKGWKYVYEIQSKGTRSERRIGKLFLNGEEVKGEIGELNQEPIGFFLYFGEGGYNRGWLNTLTYDQGVFDDEGNPSKKAKALLSGAREREKKAEQAAPSGGDKPSK
jgi:hypothetical protein